ncbi:hypothetical protein C3K47_02650 [Solitalea longa]|uniref:L,D-TPase catalytic domain-containing protein n=1 Tax=Solitalea longa TaxID=2079460 RepID=A0A2S5A728_9SPHI|nr:L,D-transpeptidase family protein [Solitalea longa]POY38316.1 hypothetical protein C3K47_02650 [Solitalea longa]
MILLRLAFLISIGIGLIDLPADNFKQQQLANERVKGAYANHSQSLFLLLNIYGIERQKMEILLCAYKNEQLLEVWARNKGEQTYKLIKEYPFCSLSGVLGPKRKEGDRQVPEGFYYIDRFNPNSLFHLSLGINYPNQSDKLLGDKFYPGGDVFIHGKCVTIGCIPLTDEKINELYILAVEATNNGQVKIPAYLFPFKMTEKNFNTIVQEKKTSGSLKAFWMNLKTGYQKFNKSPKPLAFKIDKKGMYVFL